ncbi:acetyltransferase [uncultured Hymenobacter sp.]|uniref:acetyltransferase n=1 Tax=uncultured Hymenobacter sp. TaxID=170016 RepID=UPI0035CB29AD
MLIAGAKGFAKEVLEILSQAGPLPPLAFYDDVSTDLPPLLYGQFPILRTPEDTRRWLAQDPAFVLGTGHPALRRQMAARLRELGGELTSTFSPKATIGRFGVEFGPGCNVVTNVVLTADIRFGEGVLANVACVVGHDCVIEDYCELGPGSHLSGHVELGENCVLGTSAVLLPGVKIGANSIVGAGSVVTKDVPPFSLAVGIPAKVIRHLA